MSNLATITNNILADSGIDDINVVVTNGSYANPAWITSLAWTKITGAPANIVTGTGNNNYIAKFTSTGSTIGNSVLSEGSDFMTVDLRGFRVKQPGQISSVTGLNSTNFYYGLTFEDSSTNAYSMGYTYGGLFTINHFNSVSTYTKLLSLDSLGNMILSASIFAVVGTITNGTNIKSTNAALSLTTADGSTGGIGVFPFLNASNWNAGTPDSSAGIISRNQYGSVILASHDGSSFVATRYNADIYAENTFVARYTKDTIDLKRTIYVTSVDTGAAAVIAVGAALGGAAGDYSYNYFSSTNVGNNSYIESGNLRISSGSDWTSSGYRIQQKIDNTWMGYIQFSGTGNNAGFSIGTGSTTVSRQTVTERFVITNTGTIKFASYGDNGFVKTSAGNGTLIIDTTSYQPLLTNPVTGTGTNNYIPKFTSTGSTIGNSVIVQVGNNIGVNISPIQAFDVAGTGRFFGGSYADVGYSINNYINLSIGSYADFQQNVILLHPIYDGTAIDFNYCNGKITVTRGTTSAGLISDTYYVNTASAYLGVLGSLTSYSGEGQLVTCMYGGVKYLALIPLYRTSAAQYNFDGYIRGNSNSLLVVVYRNSLTGTVINAEVNSSITPYVSTIPQYYSDTFKAKTYLGTWNGDVIGSTYGGAGTITGIMYANGSGTVSAAVAANFPTLNQNTTGYAASLGGYGNQTEYTILSGPASGPQIRIRYDSATDNRYIDLGYQDNSGTYTSGLKIYDNNTITFKGVNIVRGSGVANWITYWVDASTIGGLTTATYPSLTELSYVKGVTSAIQTQLNSKQATLSLTTTGTSGVATLIGATLNIPDYGGALSGYLPLTGGALTGALSITTATSPALNIVKDPSVDNRYIRLSNSQAAGKNWDIINQANVSGNNFLIYNSTDNSTAVAIAPAGDATFSSSVRCTYLNARSNTNALGPSSAGAFTTADGVTGGINIFPYLTAGNYNSAVSNGDTGFISNVQYAAITLASHDGSAIRVSRYYLDLYAENAHRGRVYIDGIDLYRPLKVASVAVGTPVIESTSASLGASSGNYSFDKLNFTNNGNGSYIESGSIRTSAGSDWTSAGYRIQQRIDSTYMGWIQFNGSNRNGGVSIGTGISSASRQSISERFYINASGDAYFNNTLTIYGQTTFGNNARYDPGDQIDWYLQGAANGPTIRMKYSGGTSNRSGSLAWLDNAGGRVNALTWIDSIVTIHERLLIPLGATIASSTPSITFTATGLGRTSTIGMTDGANMYINSSSAGNLYIGGGTTTFVNGAMSVSSSVTATSFFESSDARLKSNIINLDVDASGITAKHYVKNGVEEIGYLAQDVETILPSAISKRDDGYLNLSYRQVHTAKIAYLEKRINELEKQLKNK